MEDVKRTESEQDIGEVRDVSKSISIVGVELGKEAETEDVTKGVKKKMFWCMRLRYLFLLSLFKNEKRRRFLCQENIKGNWKISTLV